MEDQSINDALHSATLIYERRINDGTHRRLANYLEEVRNDVDSG